MIIGTKEEKLDNVKPCVYCGEYPKLVTSYFSDMSESQEIACQTDNPECIVFNYVKIYDNDINDAINRWNEKNS